MEIKKVAVLGSGIMGRGIAQVCAQGGFQVKLNDINMDVLNKARSIIVKNLTKGVQLGKLKQEDMAAALAQLALTDNFENAVADADLVIEVVPEDLQLKLEVFAKLDKLCPEHTILASNTSAKSITEIAAATKRPHKVIGLHFFNPVHLMKLVEIVKGLETNEETYELSEAACRQMGKETVKINEYPGFVTSRINAMIGNEAFYMLEQGVGSPEDIDKALKLGLNHPMGPFEMIDVVGLDTRLKVLEYLHESLGDKYRPAPLLVKYVKAGRLGRKVGKGVYEYPES
ncbi:MAG: 3-hydroxyacyl-CoA dehydrogenase [Desulfitobacteriaceae bacterium]|nr:3-hydroxyacyl-CoA dehydrogenase [Desulfitobacteriaceae bacterium]MDI6914678.1 3-hydroxyacyl-CoA dehydrogenase [Desulfitobacteriaceae bacterium]